MKEFNSPFDFIKTETKFSFFRNDAPNKNALVLCGHIRTLFDNWDYFDKIINTYSCDLYIETWEKYGFWSNVMEDNGYNEETDLIDAEKIKQKTNCKYLNIEVDLDFRNYFKERVKKFEGHKFDYVRTKNILAQWYKRRQVIDYINNLYKYETIILTRPDLRILGWSNLRIGGDNLQISTAVSSNMFGDTLFIGNQENITTLTRLDLHAEEIINDTKMDGHIILKWWVEKSIKKEKYELVSYETSLYNTPKGYCAL
jgi:hypothetical protein